MKNKKLRKGAIALIAIIAVAAAAGVYAMGSGNNTVYKEIAVETRDITTYLEFSGNVEAVNVSNIYSDVSAKAVEVLVEKGDKVKKGDVIALLDSSDTEYNISLKETSLKLAKLQNSYNIKDSKTSVDNLNEQIASGSNSTLNAAQKSLLTAQDNFQNAADKYNTSKAEYENETADSIVSAKKSLQSAQLTYNLNITKLEKQKEDTEAQGKDAYDYTAQKAVYENTLAQAKKDLDEAKKNVKEQVDDDYEAFVKAENALLDAEKDYEASLLGVSQNVESSQNALEKTQALANVEATEMELAHLKESLGDFTIYAPMDGFVTELNIKAGENVTTNAAIAEITDLSTMRAAIKIDEYDAGKVKNGDSVQVYINALDQMFEGKIASISKKAVIESDVSYLEAYVEFDAKDEVNSGLSAEIKLVKASEKNAAALPTGAIGYEPDKTAYVLKKGADGKPVKVYVTLGVTDGSYVHVKGDVKSGDIILVTLTADESAAASGGIMIGGSKPGSGNGGAPRQKGGD